MSIVDENTNKLQTCEVKSLSSFLLMIYEEIKED